MKVWIVLVILAAGILGSGLPAEDAPPSAGPVFGPTARDVQDLVFCADTRPVFVRLHLRIDGQPFRDAFQKAAAEHVKHLFRYLDRNGDGLLTEAEAVHCPSPMISLPGVSGDSAGDVNFAFHFQAIDSNGDGKLTRAELAEYYRQYNGDALHVQFRPSPFPRNQAVNDALFRRLDLNKDGKLSKQELAAAALSLAELDTNDDELISAQELVPVGFSPADAGAIISRPVRDPSLPEDHAFFLLNPGESRALLARKLLTHFGPVVKQLGDKKLTRKEIGLDRTTFDGLDRNKDGRLDAGELEQFSERTPDIELVIRLGVRAKGEAVVEVLRPTTGAPLARFIRRPQDGEVVLTLGRSRLELRCHPGSAGPEYLAAMRRVYRAQFKAADGNGNGFLDEKEARRSRFFRNVFARMDRNGDGKLSEKEMLFYLDRVQARQCRMMASRASLVISDRGLGLFDLLDKNRDGRLSLRELRGAVGLLAELDGDGDGRLSAREIPHSYQLTVGQGQASLNRMAGDAVVVGRDGLPVYPPETQRGGPLWFRKMDRNGDGDVSPREFLGTRADFRRLDTDGDGLISVEEANLAERGRQQGKGQ